MHAGHLIREARRQAGFTQAELADKLGTAQPNVARWESAAMSPTVDVLLKVLSLCNCDLLVRLLPRTEAKWDELETGVVDLTAEERLQNLVTFVDTLEDGKGSRPAASNG